MRDDDDPWDDERCLWLGMYKYDMYIYLSSSHQTNAVI